MPSKTSIALFALLAASVSALPTRGNSYTDLFARGPDTPASGVVADASGGTGAGASAVAQPPAVGGPSLSSSGPGPIAAGTGSHPHHPHSGTNGHPHPVHRRTHSGELSQMSSQGNVHHPGPHPHRRLSHDLSTGSVGSATPVTPSASGSGSATVAAPPTGPQQSLTRREFYENPEFERRGLLETLGLKARVATLTVKQTEQLTKAKTICGGLASKKDQHTCHKNVDKIIQLTKERNYDVEQFIKITNHHDVFTSSDPSLKSSSTPSSTSSSSSSSRT